ncbi:MAG: endolytic transglycosylase MltG [Patescibacteria group bacterium]|nr:endolytic transglycosylase MltG [Patescibacteria group bacterium]
MPPPIPHNQGPSWRPALTRGRQFLEQYQTANRLLPLAFLVGIFIFLAYFFTFGPPLSFPSGSYLRVEQGQTIAQVAAELKARHIIRSSVLFEGMVRMYGERVIAGEYFFEGQQGVITVAARIAGGDFEIVPVRVRIPEGATAKDITKLLGQKIPDFDATTFQLMATPKEGHLFPDTYFILPGEDPGLVMTALTTDFNVHIDQASTSIKKFGKPLGDVIIMASLLEKEAADTQSRRIIAGILWHRIQLGMALQVDAVFPYIIGKNSFQLTHDDLKVNSPYNTYIHKGLPPGPIANPSMSSILAAVTPIKTNYLYYLSDRHGNFHYCATYSCQLQNQHIYLGN